MPLINAYKGEYWLLWPINKNRPKPSIDSIKWDDSFKKVEAVTFLYPLKLPANKKIKVKGVMAKHSNLKKGSSPSLLNTFWAKRGAEKYKITLKVKLKIVPNSNDLLNTPLAIPILFKA